MEMRAEKMQRDKDIVLSEHERALIRSITQPVINIYNRRYRTKAISHIRYELPVSDETIEIVKSLNSKVSI